VLHGAKLAFNTGHTQTKIIHFHAKKVDLAINPLHGGFGSLDAAPRGLPERGPPPEVRRLQPCQPAMWARPELRHL
jgi:hypothetical protein